jgi:uncharacterized damage-inducible protein DinB
MSFHEDLFSNFSELHADTLKAIDGLSTEALDWIPGPEMNSITVLVVHLTGAERYWIGVALNEPPVRDREAEFKTKNLSMDALKALLVSADDYARQALNRLGPSDLETIRQSPRNAKSFSAVWCLAHALAHTALHTGHIQLTRQLWDQDNKAKSDRITR